MRSFFEDHVYSYNTNQTMFSKILMAKLLYIVLGFALLIGLLPMSNHLSSIQTTRMDKNMISVMADFQINPVPGNANDNSSGSCCDALGPFSSTCAFVVPQSACVPLYGDIEQVLNSAPVFQSIYIKAVAPPPKA